MFSNFGQGTYRACGRVRCSGNDADLSTKRELERGAVRKVFGGFSSTTHVSIVPKSRKRLGKPSLSLSFSTPLEISTSYSKTRETHIDETLESGGRPATEAELAHVRNMIAALSKSLDAYKTAEQQLCASGKNDTSLQL